MVLSSYESTWVRLTEIWQETGKFFQLDSYMLSIYSLKAQHVFFIKNNNCMPNWKGFFYFFYLGKTFVDIFIG